MIYIYDCEACGRFEFNQSMKEDPLTVCPHCGGKVRRVITGGGGVLYRCGGFYSKPVVNLEQGE